MLLLEIIVATKLIKTFLMHSIIVVGVPKYQHVTALFKLVKRVMSAKTSAYFNRFQKCFGALGHRFDLWSHGVPVLPHHGEFT